ncbi:hypothetical protein R1flu_006583 [Riccia fluitans]|uniref:Uncharacterized protein n=1 Tax=Riccia fluitans TaxID=41844 RepID=A0ABD1YWE5_9MARC
MSSTIPQVEDFVVINTSRTGSSPQHSQSPNNMATTSLKNLKTTTTEAAAHHRPPQSEFSEIQIVHDGYEILNAEGYGSSPMSMSEDSRSYSFSDSQLITDNEDNDESLMQLKLEAMTWAAMAKDFTISSLEKRLRKALQIAKAEQVKNVELQSALDQSQKELSRSKEEIIKLEEAEERLAREHGESQVDAVNFVAERAKLHAEQARQHRSQLLMLEHRIRLMLGEKVGFKGQRQDRYSQQDSYWQGSDAEILELELAKSQERERTLAAKYSQAEHEIEDLKSELEEVKIDLRISDVLRKTQSRRLKVLERERRYLIKKGALRTVKLAAPRTQPKQQESPTPGGSATRWLVTSADESIWFQFGSKASRSSWGYRGTLLMGFGRLEEHEETKGKASGASQPGLARKRIDAEIS